METVWKVGDCLLKSMEERFDTPVVGTTKVLNLES